MRQPIQGIQNRLVRSNIARLIEQDRKIFRTADLALIWGMSNKNTLYTTIKRYVDRFLLFPISKGLYSMVSPDKLSKDQIVFSLLHRYAYISTETILVEYGVIFQNVPYLTLVSEISEKGKILDIDYKIRQLKSEFLYNDLGVIKTEEVAKASLERAIADLLYFDPSYYIDNKSSVDWKKVKEIQDKVYKIKK